MDTLAAFIVRELQAILADWDTFAGSRTEGSPLTKERLRDHAEEILRAVAADIGSTQTGAEQTLKSEGGSDDGRQPLDSAARVHAIARMADQFSVNDLVAEFRAVRASVLRKWAATQPTGPGRVEEVTRFNEAVDQALAASMAHYHAHLEEARTVILGVLAHDLRTPLSAISLSAQFILRTETSDPRCLQAATRTLNSAGRMKTLIHDLLDYTSTRLGIGMPLDRRPMDLKPLIHGVIEEVEASNPGRRILPSLSGSSVGEWDEGRLGQLLTNLLRNAIDHGSKTEPVRLTVEDDADADGVVMRIENQGPPIPEARRAALFRPLGAQQRAWGAATGSSGLGLGLYIAAEIATAHLGRVALVSSDDAGTVFAIHLPRR